MKKINLLPKAQQAEIKYELMYRGVRTFAIVSGIVFLLVFAGQLTTKAYLDLHIKKIDSNIERLQAAVSKDENTKLKDKIKQVNAQIQDYKVLSDRVPKWSRFLRAFVAVVPPDVRINNLSADLVKRRVDIGGLAETREDALQLHANILTRTNEFTDINYPFENLVKNQQTQFRYTFLIQPDLLK